MNELSPPLGLLDVMPFGKHKGQQVEDLIHEEPSYMQYLVENDICEFDDAVLELMRQKNIC